MKQKLLILLCAIMAAITANATFADYIVSYDFTVDGIYYKITDNNAKTVAVTYEYYDEKEVDFFSDYTGVVNIPSSVSNDGIIYSVTSIREYAFCNCRGITSIVIPNSVTSIALYAFSSCSALTSIVIPNSVTSIGDFAFGYCWGLKSIVIPNSVTSIERLAFAICQGLTSVTIRNDDPKNIILGSEVFYMSHISKCTLYVPEGSQGLYDAADQWKAFGSIKAIPTVNITDGENYAGTEYQAGAYINYTRTFSNNYWQALYLPFTPGDADVWGEDYEFAELASVATEGEDEVMTWAKVNVSDLEAGKPYIVRYTGETAPGEVSMMFPNGSDAWADNYTTTDPLKTVASTTCTYDLYGNTTTQNLDAGAYALYQGNFYQSTGNNSLPAQRFYIKATVKTGQHAPARIKVKVGDEPAGVIFPEVDQIFPIDENYYDLQGRRVEHPQSGQIYIHNGQKILK